MPHKIVAVGPSADPIPLLPGEATIFSVHPSVVPMLTLIFAVLAIGFGISYFFFTVNIAALLGFPQYQLIIGLVPFTIALIVTFIIFLTWLNTIYTLTSIRVQWEFGIFGQRNRSIANMDIQAVQVDQGFVGKIFNYGDVSVRSAQQPIPIDFIQISSPRVRAEQIEDEAT